MHPFWGGQISVPISPDLYRQVGIVHQIEAWVPPVWDGYRLGSVIVTDTGVELTAVQEI